MTYAATPGRPATERCAVLIGSQRFATTLHHADRGRFVISGWPGLALGMRLHLILDRGQSLVQECEVIGASALGIELAVIDGLSMTDDVDAQSQTPTPVP